MTKEEVLKEFKEIVLPSIVERYGKEDKVAIRTAWVDYTDSLSKDGYITEKQCENWSNPF